MKKHFKRLIALVLGLAIMLTTPGYAYACEDNMGDNANETSTASSIGDFSMDGGVGELLSNTISNSNALYSDDGIEVSNGDIESIEKLKEMNINSFDSYDEDRIVKYDDKENFGVYKEEVVRILEKEINDGTSKTYENELIDENYGASIKFGQNCENVNYEIVLRNCNGDIDNLKSGDIFAYNTIMRPNLKRLFTCTVLGRAVYVKNYLGTVYIGVDSNVELTDVFDYVKIETDVDNVSNETTEGENSEDVDTSGNSTHINLSSKGVNPVEIETDDISFSSKEEDGLNMYEVNLGFSDSDDEEDEKTDDKQDDKEIVDEEEDGPDKDLECSGSITLGIGFSYNCDVYVTPTATDISIRVDYKLKSQTEINLHGTMEIELFNVKARLLYGAIEVKFTPKFELDGEVNLTFSNEVKGAFGFTYSNENGFKKLDTKPEYNNSRLDVELKVEVGVDFDLTVSILSEDVISVTGTIGLRLTLSSSIYVNTDGNDGTGVHLAGNEAHICSVCYGGAVGFKITYGLKLNILTKELPLSDGDLLEKELFKWHCSDRDNYKFEKGECEHRLYKTKITTLKMRNHNLLGETTIKFTVPENVDITEIYKANGYDLEDDESNTFYLTTDSDNAAVEVYLPAGSYYVEATCGNAWAGTKKLVIESAEDIINATVELELVNRITAIGVDGTKLVKLTDGSVYIWGRKSDFLTQESDLPIRVLDGNGNPIKAEFIYLSYLDVDVNWGVAAGHGGDYQAFTIKDVNGNVWISEPIMTGSTWSFFNTYWPTGRTYYFRCLGDDGTQIQNVLDDHTIVKTDGEMVTSYYNMDVARDSSQNQTVYKVRYFEAHFWLSSYKYEDNENLDDYTETRDDLKLFIDNENQEVNLKDNTSTDNGMTYIFDSKSSYKKPLESLNLTVSPTNKFVYNGKSVAPVKTDYGYICGNTKYYYQDTQYGVIRSTDFSNGNDIKVMLGKTELLRYIDYEVEYDRNPIDAGTYNLTIKGIGDYSGQITSSYTINTKEVYGIALDSWNFNEVQHGTSTYHIYNGGIEWTAYDSNSTVIENLVNEIDYDVTYDGMDIEGGTYIARFAVTFKGNYTGTFEKTYSLLYSTDYNHSIQSNKTEIKVGESTQISLLCESDCEGRHSFINLTPNIAKLEQDANGNYNVKGLSAGRAEIRMISYFEYGDITIEDNNLLFITVKQSCTHGNVSIINKKNPTYDKEGYTGDKYCNNCKTIIAKGSVIKKLSRVSISSAKVTGITDKTYTGKSLTQTVKVSKDGKTLKNGTDYTISYSNNKNLGTATVIITGKGKYTGTIKKNFAIKLAKEAAPSLSNTSKGVNVKWTKVAGAKGYLVYRKLSGKSYYKIATVGASTLSFVDTKAVSGKYYSYYVVAYNGNYKSSYSYKTILRLANMTISSGKSTRTGIKLTWKRATGATGYYVYKKSSNGSYKLISNIKRGSTVTYTDTKTSRGKKYTYCVVAYNGGYRSSYYSKTIKR